MTCRHVAVLVAGLAFEVVATAAAAPVREVVIEANTKTTDATVRVLAGIHVGDEFGPGDALRVQKLLVTSGLFKDVVVVAAPVENGVRVRLIVHDKHSWVVAPAFYAQPTNRGGGLGFGENNLFGLDQKLLLYGQIATGESFFLGAFLAPSLFGTRFKGEATIYFDSQRAIEYASPQAWRTDPRPVRVSRMHYLNLGAKVGYQLSHDASVDVRVRGAQVTYRHAALAPGASIADVTGDPLSTVVPPPSPDGWDVSTELLATLDRRANWYGIATGYKLLATFEKTQALLGSDYDYWYAGLRSWGGLRLFTDHNLTEKTWIGVGHDLPFQQEYTAGGPTMRGFKNGQLRGDLRAISNVEYSVPIGTVHRFGLSLRGLGFWDSAYTTFLDAGKDQPFRDYLPGANARGLAPLKNSVGLGTRLYLHDIVLPLLGLDLGYGVERRAFEIYLAVGLTDY